MASAHLAHRGIIRISGEDKFDFLQGIVTQDMRLLQEDRLLYSCLLTPQGKYLADFFMMAQGDDWLLDIDRNLLPDMLKRLTLFKLRSRVTLTDASDDFAVYAFWQGDGAPQNALPDPRALNIGHRLVAHRGNAITHQSDDYTIWQLQNGLPDIADFQRERTAMLEANMDKLNALSWDKGCYMGQELTARTHYRGLIKKRFLPIRFAQDVAIPIDTPVEKGGQIIGYTRSQKKNWVLALLQLDGLKHKSDLTIQGQNAKIIFPTWF